MKNITTIALCVFSGLAFAAEPFDATNLASMISSLVVVLVVIVVLAWFVKRLNPNLGASEHFKVVRSMPLGTKERLMIIEVDNKQHLLGVTPNSINYLYELKTPLPETAMPPMAKGFSTLLNTTKKNKHHD
ncbi:Flagellar biosynthesis protein FliO [Pseudoalteromonas luteoviolacea B = ATCC 29581]|nr:Flagellar biosynthesis protein FliO [Pseudoalteromonas luteoviolacea B = ATCC 29581]